MPRSYLFRIGSLLSHTHLAPIMTAATSHRVRARLRCCLNISLVVAALNLGGAQGADPTVATRKSVDFSHSIVPILKKHCAECHAGHEAKGGFSFNSRGLMLEAEVVTPGMAENSRLWQLITSQDPEDQMPPKDRPRLTMDEVDTLRVWIEEGLKWDEGVTFAASRYEPPLRPRRPELPPVTNGRQHPIDRIIDAYLAEHDIQQPQIADDATYLRRVSMDLVGLPPTVDELTTFLAETSVDKRGQWVRHLLNQREAYATHWLTFWNDLLRNAYSGTGFIDDGRSQITQWLYQALLENKAYDRFVRELVAPVSPESAGFVKGVKWRGNVNASQVPELQFAQSVGQVFLGINMKCASCHDSFIDRWKLDEAYGLAAIVATEPLQVHRCDKPVGRVARAAWIFPELGQVDPDAPQPERLRQVAELLTHPENGRLARTIVNRIWHRMMGRGIVHPVDAMQSPPWHADLLDFLATYLVDQHYDLQKVCELIATSQAYQARSVIQTQAQADAAESYTFRGPVARRLTAEQFLDTVWLVTNTWPEPDNEAFERDGRQQGGQLAALLAALRPAGAGAVPADRAAWGGRHWRAALQPLDRLQASLGRPNREQVVSSRPAQLTTLEGITLSNDPRLAEILKQGAAQWMGRSAPSTDAMIEGLFRASLSRPPTSDELQVAREILGESVTEQSLEDLLWNVFMLPEFQWIQ